MTNISIRKYLLLCCCLFLTVACIDEEEYDDSPQGNFEALWRIMDEHYCFFTDKQIDWNAIYNKYQRQVEIGMSQGQLFEVLANMIGELKDGHVNLYTSFDVARNWSWHEDYPSNYSDTLITHYLGTDYKIASGLRYKTLDDNIGYVRYSSFTSAIGNGNLDDIFMDLAPCRALIIDIRDNSGGTLTYAEKFAARFTNKEMLVGYMRHKKGKGHDDFSDYEEQILKPSKNIRWQKPVYLLTNRQVFSAANEFVKYMKCCPNVTII
ncbi:MAG: S41 family peptidase, partial [Prevotella sp.]|nr:S41 family peptidase [Prevotella sp.]